MKFLIVALVCAVLSLNAFAQENNLNVALTVPQGYEKVYPGGDLVVELGIMNLGAEKRVDVVVDYSIKSQDGTSLLDEKETLAVETKASFVKTLRIPKEAKPGKYSVTSNVEQVTDPSKKGSSSASFEIAESPKDLLSVATGWAKANVLWIVSAAVVMLAAFLVYKSRRKIRGLVLENKVRSMVRERIER